MKQAFRDTIGGLAACLIVAIATAAPASAAGAKKSPAPSTAPRAADPAPAVAPATDIKFRDFFRTPVGPRGLELTEQIRALDGQQVRIVGYMVKDDEPTPGMFILSPLPVELGEEDERYADDLPPAALFVHLADHASATVPFHPGLIRLTGTLSVGSREEADGRVSTFQLQLDAPTSRSLVHRDQHASN